MKHFLLLLFSLLLFVSHSQEEDLIDMLKYEHILSYHSDIHVQKNCHVRITETIKVYAEGNDIRRGIYRDLPTSYEYKGGNVHVGFELLEVKRNGNPEPHHTESLSNGVRIYAGSSDFMIESGVHTYEFTYDVHRVLGFFDEYDEIYWNVNGNGWAFTIDSISADVYFPEGAKLVQFDGYTGWYGSTQKNFVATEIDGGVRYQGTGQLIGGQNLTVAVAWDKNHVVYPSDLDELLFWIESYILWVIGGLGVLFVFIYNFRMWTKYGRDPKPGTIIPLFYPPTGFSPAECIYLKKAGRTSNSMFGSMLISLAVKGMVEIDVEKSGILRKKVYTIRRIHDDVKKAKKPLTELEIFFLGRLLGTRSSITFQSGKHNAKIESAHNSLISRVDKIQKDVYYVRNSHLKVRQYIVPLVTAGLGGLALYIYGGSIAALVVSFLIMMFTNLIFLRLYEQPTTEGRKKMDEIAGFEMYLKYADKERIRLMNPPTMNFEHYEENLAYAIALGVADEWAGQFNPVELNEAYRSHMPYITGIAIANFSDFGSDLSNAASSASTPPSSSGSGSGGGGFSGGGGGGGGGGGW